MPELAMGTEVVVRGLVVMHFDDRPFSAEAYRVKFRSEVYSHAMGNEVIVRADDVEESSVRRSDMESCVWLDPGRQGGTPCFGGTRIPVGPVMAIVEEAGEAAAKQLWPDVTDAHIKAGRAWKKLMK